MFTIQNKRKQFWQWDTGQRLIVNADVCSEVHFCNGTNDCSLVCEVYEEDGLRLVNVPNILLQVPKAIKAFVYICDGDDHHTEVQQIFPVFPRSKPYDYVYTETEIKSYEKLSARIEELEKNGVSEARIKEAVDEYLEENPVDSGIVKFDTEQTLTEEEKAMARKNIGALTLEDLPKYEGAYSVTPSAYNDTTMKTAQKYMDSDVQIKKIPYYETDNTAGGTTIYIGSDDELEIT